MANDEGVVAAREEVGQRAFEKLHAMGAEAAQAAIDIGVVMRDRELHHFETEQEIERLRAENANLAREILATNNYAIYKRGSGWDASYDLIHWDEEERVWKSSESDISKGAAITLRDTYNAARQP